MPIIARITEKAGESEVAISSLKANEIGLQQGDPVLLELSDNRYELVPIRAIDDGFGVSLPIDLVKKHQLFPGTKLYVKRNETGIVMRVLANDFNDWFQCKTCSGTFREGR